MCLTLRLTLCTFAFLCLGAMSASAKQVGRDDLLIGFHFSQSPRKSWPTTPTTPDFFEYSRWLREDLDHVSYVDVWLGWSAIERFKGDESGFADLDLFLDETTRLGIAVKIVLIHSTPWTHDFDLRTTMNLAIGPRDLDDWTHWCELMGERFRGRIATWDLQGEANGKDYWPFLEVGQTDHIHAVYRRGIQAFKRSDPKGLVGISCATPGAYGIDIWNNKISRDSLDRWYADNLAACRDLPFDHVPINYFSDIGWADLHGHGWVFYSTIRRMLDGLGLQRVELGSGESSFNWANTSFDFKTYQLSEEVQARRMNEVLGSTFSDGMNKWMIHGSMEQSPGTGWEWRWGLRKFEDMFGIVDGGAKIPGTNIVYAGKSEKGELADLRPAWSRPADPWMPAMAVYRFWSQAMPRGAEAIRLPISPAYAAEGQPPYALASFLRKKNEAVLLACTGAAEPLSLTIDMSRAGWPGDTILQIEESAKSIDFKTGLQTEITSASRQLIMSGNSLQLGLNPKTSGTFTTVRIRPVADWDAALIDAVHADKVEVGTAPELHLIMRNTGRDAWQADDSIRIMEYTESQAATEPVETKVGTMLNREPVEPGAAGVFKMAGNPLEECGWHQQRVRLRSSSGWFGPVMTVDIQAVDSSRPRKLVAFSEPGQVRLVWFPPENGHSAARYAIYRAHGHEGEPTLLTETDATDYVDATAPNDVASYYHIIAIGADGRRSRPSARDNARPRTAPKLYDAQLTALRAPATLFRGTPDSLRVRLKNTGSRPWQAEPEVNLEFSLRAVRLWDAPDAAGLPSFPIRQSVPPQGEVEMEIPYVGPRAGRFENQWVVVGQSKFGQIWMGTPLLLETEVTQ